MNVLGKEGRLWEQTVSEASLSPGSVSHRAQVMGDLCVCRGTADPMGKKSVKGSVPAFARTSGS